MSDSPLRIVPHQPVEPDQPEKAASTEVASQQEQLTELRRLLVEPEQTQLNNVLERLNNPRVRAREMSRLLSEAVKLRAAQDDSLTEALAPTIVTSFHNSVKKDPRPVADAISPLMGPAIRRAISTALSAMVQTFDQALKHSLSWQGVKWRIEAFRTGQSFAEVVLRHTLVYRVEQVFLIHKSSGLLLQHIAARTVETQDADIVSGMLTAIQEAIRSFARDSFGGPSVEHIDTLDLGDREVWFEPSSHAVIAVVIRGKAPESLRADFFAPAIEAIQYEQRESLEPFDGDTNPFELSRPHLESCLLSKYDGQVDPGKYKTPRYFWLLLALSLAAIGAWAFLAWRENRRWDDYLNKLRAQPGIVIAEEGSRDGKLFVAGLRDPLAADPETILKEQTPLDPSKVISRWEPYLALTPPIVRERARSMLQPPKGVELKFERGVLSVTGAAPHQWIADMQRLARAIPGVTQYDDSNLIDEDLDEIRRRIERSVIRFLVGTAKVASGQDQTIKTLTAQIQRLVELAPASSRAARIEIVGHTDTEGDENTNQRLSEERSIHTLMMLAPGSASQEIFFPRGAASKEPVGSGASLLDKEINRSVSFKVSLLLPNQTASQPPQQKEPRR